MNKEEIIAKIEQINAERFSELNGRSIISVSKLEEIVSEPFDAEKQAKVCAEKGKKDPKYKYAGMEAEEILAAWNAKADESKMYGTLSDDYSGMVLTGDTNIEIWKLDHNYDYDDRLRNNCIGFDQFYADMKAMGFEYVGREIQMYLETPDNSAFKMPLDDEEGGNIVVGRLDNLWYHPVKGKFFIIDYKTTDEIKTSAFGGRKLKGPAYQWEDCDMGKYTIQLHSYKASLIKTYGIANENDVAVAVVNFRQKPDEKTGKNYLIYKQNFDFNLATLYKVIDFGIKKRKLLKGY